jgi:hypothetical protein
MKIKNTYILQFSFRVLTKSIAANVFTVLTLQYFYCVSMKDFHIDK